MTNLNLNVNPGFIEIKPGLWYCEKDGSPWSSKYRVKGGYRGEVGLDGILKPLECLSQGYRSVIIDGVTRHWHKLVYECFNGSVQPGYQIDHINNDRDDSRLCNLQAIPRKDNARFRKMQTNNNSGYPGVTRCKRPGKFRARILVDGKTIYLGNFKCPKEAYKAYLEAKVKYHGLDSIRCLPTL